MRKFNYSTALTSALLVSQLGVIQPMTPAYAKEASKPKKLDGQIESPFTACKHVPIVTQSAFELDPDKYKNQNCANCTQLQISPDAGFGVGSIKNFENADYATQAKDLMDLVANQMVSNLDKSISRFEQAGKCYSDDAKSQPDCQKIREQTEKDLSTVGPKLRRELALARAEGSADDGDVSFGEAHPNPDAFINSNMAPYELFSTDPFKGVKLTDKEMDAARNQFNQEQQEILDQASKRLVAQGKPPIDSSGKPSPRQADVVKELRQAKRKEHRDKYLNLIYSGAPIFGSVSVAKGVDENGVPTFDDDQIRKGYQELAKYAQDQKDKTQQSLRDGKLEFGRFFEPAGTAKDVRVINPHAGPIMQTRSSVKVLTPDQTRLWKTFIKGDRDLLDYIVFTPIVNDVLKENPKYCGIATGLVTHNSNREIQNQVGTAAVMLPLFVGLGTAGTIATIAGETALTGASLASGLGIAMGMGYTYDSYKDYRDVNEEVKTGIQDPAKLKEAENAMITQAAMHGLDYVGAGSAGKLLYTALAKKVLSKDVVDMASHMNPKATAQSGALNKALWSKVLGASDDQVTHDIANDFVKNLFRHKAEGRYDGLASLSDNEMKGALELMQGLDFKAAAKDPAKALRLKVVAKDASDMDPKFFEWNEDARKGMIAFMQKREERLAKMSDKQVKELMDDPAKRFEDRKATLKEMGVKDEDAHTMAACPMGPDGHVKAYLESRGEPAIACWAPKKKEGQKDIKTGEIHGKILNLKDKDV